MGFSLKTKNLFFRGSKLVVFKLKFWICFLRLFFYVKESFMPIFTKQYQFLGPLEFLKMKTLLRNAHAPMRSARVRAKNLNLDF